MKFLKYLLFAGLLSVGALSSNIAVGMNNSDSQKSKLSEIIKPDLSQHSESELEGSRNYYLHRFYKSLSQSCWLLAADSAWQKIILKKMQPSSNQSQWAKIATKMKTHWIKALWPIPFIEAVVSRYYYNCVVQEKKQREGLLAKGKPAVYSSQSK